MPEQYWGHPVTPAEEAVRLRRAQAGDNPACLPGLAAALTDLGICYGGVGRDQDAIAPVEEAVRLYRALAGDNPAYLPGLAAALTAWGAEMRSDLASIIGGRPGSWSDDAVLPVSARVPTDGPADLAIPQPRRQGT